MKYISYEICGLEVELADNFFKRLSGLMFRKSIPQNYGLFIYPCSSIHTCFMKFTIDVLYFDKEFKLLYKESVKPWRVGKILKGVYAVLECREGMSERFCVGDKYKFV